MWQTLVIGEFHLPITFCLYIIEMNAVTGCLETFFIFVGNRLINGRNNLIIRVCLFFPLMFEVEIWQNNRIESLRDIFVNILASQHPICWKFRFSPFHSPHRSVVVLNGKLWFSFLFPPVNRRFQVIFVPHIFSVQVVLSEMTCYCYENKVMVYYSGCNLMGGRCEDCMANVSRTCTRTDY